MACIIRVKIKYDDNSASQTQDFTCVDSFPSAEVVKACEQQLLDRWMAMGKGTRGIQFHTTIHKA